ncbi:MAG: CHAD domain-containing protein [Desulfocapsaceae bacterium]|nr:CHAD domain-containing protein [Desulfocapsaceae bacterium]
MKSGYRTFTIAGPEGVERLLRKIRGLYSLREETADDIDEQYLDTFDGRLSSRRLALRQTERRFVLAAFSGTPSEETEGPQKPRIFWQDFPEGKVKDMLAPISGVRALCPLFRVVGRRRHFRVCNRDEKVVLRLQLETGDLYVGEEKREAFAPRLHLEGMRGYHKQFQRVSEVLGENDCQNLEPGQTPVDLFFSQLQIRPDENKIRLCLGKDQTASQAISLIGQGLLAGMKRNLPGVLEDIDSEFLHDFRVAIRRTRALLSQFKQEIPPGQAGIFQDEFRWLGSVAGPVRDLDVCLQKEAIYRGLLPDDMHAGLSGFMEKIAEWRERQAVIMRDHLQSARAAALFANWSDFLSALPSKIQMPQGQIPCRKAARKVVRRCFLRLLRDARRTIRGDMQDVSIHKLRIQAKKFRYMAEFFRGFFPAPDMDALVSDLRGLQDDLGDFNDLAVQIRRFQEYGTALSLDRIAGETLDALLVRLEVEKKRLLKKCLKRCMQFMKQDRTGLF